MDDNQDNGTAGGEPAAPVERQHSTQNHTSPAAIVKPVPAPDLKEPNRFLQSHIRDDRPGIDCYTFQTFDDGKEKRPALARIFHGPGNATKLIELNAAGAGIFMMINAGDGKGRKAENVTRVRAVFVDIDKDGPVVLARIAAGLAPHSVVESSPGKFHVYWLVDGDFPRDKFTAVQEALAQKFGTDTVKDLPRVLRLPGFYHLKKPADPFQVRIVELNDHAPYSIEQVVDGLGLTLDAPARVQATTSPPSATKPAAPTRDADVIDRNEERARSECEIALAEVAKADEGTRNNALLKFIYTLRDRGISKELCFEYGLRFANEKCSPSYDVGQARATIRSAIRSARNQAGSRSEIEEVRGAAIARDFEVLSDHEQAKPMFTLASSRVTQASILAVEPPEFIVTRGKHGYMTRGLNGVLAGTGGISKTTFILTLMICFATGRKFLDHFTVKTPMASLLVSAEDSLDELRRRLKRVCVEMALSPAEWAAVEKYVHVVSLMDQPHAIIARGDHGGFRRTDFCTRLRDACTSLPIQPEFIVLDPVSHLAEADEVDNAARAALANEAAKLADALNATVFLVSHVSKAAVSSGEAAALTARGGQALTDNTRHTWSLGGVDEKLAGRMTNVDVLGVEPEEDLVGLTVQKHNPGSTMKKAFYFSKADGVPQALPEQPSFKTRGSAGAEARRIDQVPARNWVIDEVTKNSGKHTTESLVAGLRESHKVGDRWARDRVVAIRKEGIIVPRSITPDDRSKFQHAPQARFAYWPSEKGA